MKKWVALLLLICKLFVHCSWSRTLDSDSTWTEHIDLNRKVDEPHWSRKIIRPLNNFNYVKKDDSIDQDRYNVSLTHAIPTDQSVVDAVATSPGDCILNNVAKQLGWLVVIQSSLKLLSSNNNQIIKEIMDKVLNEEIKSSIRKIHSILRPAFDKNLAKFFSNVRPADVWSSMFALCRLQNAAIYYEQKYLATSVSCTTMEDVILLEDLAHYAVYANAAYGSLLLDLAAFGRHHLPFLRHGNQQTLLRRTRLPKEDLIVAHWGTNASQPVYFLVRDRVRKRLVLCLRGTWSTQDVLHDLCCAPEDLHLPIKLRYNGRKNQGAIRVHHGMLRIAKSIYSELTAVLKQEFDARPDFSLVLVGHSMGGGVAALLGLLWEDLFSGILVYAYGSPCVFSQQTALSPKSSLKIISVVHDYDPFSRLSLGHVTDLGLRIGLLCADETLRLGIMQRVRKSVVAMNKEDLKWCFDTITELRLKQTSEKLYPPGTILLVSCFDSDSKARHSGVPKLREVKTSHFQELLIRPQMFDLSRHVPANYIRCLKKIVDHLKRSTA